jgi:hypothetical protein
LTRRISKLFDKQAEEATRIVIITKNSSKEEIEKFENEIRNKEKESGSSDKTSSKNPPNET